jgi:hypothetical protein
MARVFPGSGVTRHESEEVHSCYKRAEVEGYATSAPVG